MNQKYKRQDVLDGLLKLTQELGKEPTAHEIDRCSYLPTSRQIQRRFGGLKVIRDEAGLLIKDHTKGHSRTNKAHEINVRANKYHKEYINRLFLKHHDSDQFTKCVIREFAYQQWLPDEGYYKNIASDVAISDRVKKHVTLIDFFYPSDLHSFGGCIRQKRSKLKKYPVSLFDVTHSVLFVCMNRDFSQDDIKAMGFNMRGIKVLSLDVFERKYL